MSEFSISINSVRNASSEIGKLEKKALQAEREIQDVMSKLQWFSGTYSSVLGNLKSIKKNVSYEKQKLWVLSDALGEIVTLYSDTENKIKNPKHKKENSEEVKKVLIDIVGKAGPVGIGVSTVLKVVQDGKNGKLSMKTVASGLGNIWDLGRDVKKILKPGKTDVSWKDFVGLTPGSLGDIVQSNLGVVERAKHGAATKWKSGMRDLKTKGGKISIAFSAFANGIDNYDEYKKKYRYGEVSEAYAIGRATAETIGETAVDWGKGLLIGSAVAAGFAAAGVAAPAVVVGGATVLISAGLDYGCKWATKKFMGEEKNLTELISDTVLDAGEKVCKGALKGAKTIWSGLRNGLKKI